MKRNPIVWSLLALFLVLTVWEIVQPASDHGVSLWWKHTILFDFLYGLLGCLAIVIVSKALGKIWLQRNEDYYGRDD